MPASIGAGDPHSFSIPGEFQPNRRLLREVFGDESSRRYGTFVCVDQRGSTRAKLVKSEATWVSENGRVWDTIISNAIELCSEVSYSFTGDGAMLFFDGEDHANVAAQIAVKIQEVLASLSRPADGALLGIIDVDVAIAITSGPAYWFEVAGMANAIGVCVDRAARLCGAATARAIFMDDETFSVMNTNKIKSAYGVASHRTPQQYAGDKQYVGLKSIAEKVGYYEILWEKQRFGVRSEMASPGGEGGSPDGGSSGASTAPVRPLQPVNPAGSAGRVGEKLTGRVKFYDTTKSYGFIVANDGEDFFFAPNLMAYDEDVTKMSEGIRVAFIAVAPSPKGKNLRAGAILVEGEIADGEIVAIPTTQRPYGWIEVKDQLGNVRVVYASAASLQGLSKGQQVSFKLGMNSRGAVALDIAETEDEDAA